MAANIKLAKALKEARILSGLKQKDVFERLGIKENTISNYENGVSRPDIETFVNLCELYSTDYKTILQKACGYSGIDEPNQVEQELLKKYRHLDPYGKEAVDSVLEIEHRRCTEAGCAMIRAAARGGGVSEIEEIHPDELHDNDIIP